MPETLRVGVAGLTHGHVWGLIQAAKDEPRVTLASVADNTPLLDKAKPDFENSFASWQEMLESSHLDLLIVTSDNVESSEIAIDALGRGIPCLVEKAMAANAEDADRMLEAAKNSGQKLMINWPLYWAPWLNAFKSSIDSGRIGHTFHLRYRNGHGGPKEIGCDEWFVGWLYDEQKNGGGAIADFGSYGAVLSRWLFGMPETVYCVRHNTTKDYEISDDHAIIILKYPKLDVVLEATWATKYAEDGGNPVVYGKDGALAVHGRELKLYSSDGVTTVEPEERATKNPISYFVECINSGRDPEGIANPQIAADACRILDAAILSSRTNRAEQPVL